DDFFKSNTDDADDDDVGQHGGRVKAVVQRPDTHTQAGHSAGGFGCDQGGQSNGSTQPDSGEDEGQGGGGNDPDEDVLVGGAQHPGGLDEGLIHVDHALIDGHAHDEEAGDGNHDHLGQPAHAGADDDQ